MSDFDKGAGRRGWLRVAGAAAAGLMLAGAASAQQQDWPTRPVRIVVAVAAGSSGDTLSRILAPRLEQLWKQPVIVENRPGAGGVVGTEFVVNATDNHTLLMASQSSILPKFTQKNPKYDPYVDLAAIYKVINYQMVVATNAPTAQRAKTLADVVALSKSGNGLFFGGMGPTSVFNISMAIMNQTLGARYSTVDFSNVGAMNLAVIRNDAQLLVNTPSSIKGQIETGQLVPLVAVNPERFASMPDVPTLKEATGYAGYVPQLWAGLMGPKTLPPAAVERIARDMQTLANDAALKRQIETVLSGTVLRSSPSAFAKELQDESAIWKDVFQAMNYKPE